jgi:hypothetical protein
MDYTNDAPGADDDASGVAISMELARIIAKHRPAATIKFVAVAGEEQVCLFLILDIGERFLLGTPLFSRKHTLLIRYIESLWVNLYGQPIGCEESECSGNVE